MGNRFIAEGSDEEFVCYKCGEENIREGFFCRFKKVICKECQEKMNKGGDKTMYYCTLKEKSGQQHEHLKFERVRNA